VTPPSGSDESGARPTDRQSAKRAATQRYLSVVAAEARRLRRKLRSPDLQSRSRDPYAPAEPGRGREWRFALDANEYLMMHHLADTAARRLGRRGFSQARYEQAVDRLVAAYIDWREESIAAREAYSRCDATQGHGARHAFAAYFAALEREERAAAGYAACVEQVCALGSRHGGFLVTEGAGAGSAAAPPRRPKK
jgi:hypothetical protein